MAKTQVSITYGEKTLDCELSFEPPYKLSSFCPAYVASDCEFTLESVSIVCELQLNFDGKKLLEVTHLEDIADLYFQRDNIEELAINAIMDRGYVC